MSSRNKYLSKDERKQATVLYEALREAKRLISRGERSANRVISRMTNMIKKQRSAELEYIAITDAHTLDLLNKLKGEVLISLAARFGKARLIDNIVVKVN